MVGPVGKRAGFLCFAGFTSVLQHGVSSLLSLEAVHGAGFLKLTACWLIPLQLIPLCWLSRLWRSSAAREYHHHAAVHGSILSCPA
jgi:hypothetical protein